MPLRRLPYTTLHELLVRELVPVEHDATAELIASLRHVRRLGYFTRREFLQMCRWKSPRAVRHFAANSPARIRRVSAAVLAARDERRRLTLLLSLRGVNVPMASAILTLLEPGRYGVIDIRAWQVLVALGAVGRHPDGRGFTFDDWSRYLRTLRRHARDLGVTVRCVERTLFECHRKFQVGLLYDRSVRRRDGR